MNIQIVKNKQGGILSAIIKIKIMLLAFVLLFNIACIFFIHNKVQECLTHALESAVKNIYVDASNDEIIDQDEAYNTLKNSLMYSLDLDSTLTPNNEHSIIGQIVITEISYYDKNTVGLTDTNPYTEAYSSTTFYEPTIHIKANVSLNVIGASILNGSDTLTLKFHIDESNEPVS